MAFTEKQMIAAPDDEALPVNVDEFGRWLSPLLREHSAGASVAVAVSGGPDSMALCHLLAAWGLKNNILIRAVTVNHGLRPEAKAEAEAVGEHLRKYNNIKHFILNRDVSDLSDGRLQERAREDRYALLADFCADHAIRTLFVAHHRDDQAETVLFRLAKGSGLDGLAGMKPVQAYRPDLSIVRPFLDIPKIRLVATCAANDVPYVNDPSNDKDIFARVRLRQAADILSAEGLTPKRLSVTAARLGRARAALNHYTAAAYVKCAVLESGAAQIDIDALAREPEEIRLRVIMRAIDDLTAARGYGPRRERLEEIVRDLFHDPSFTKATLGGFVFALNRKAQCLTLTPESF